MNTTVIKSFIEELQEEAKTYCEEAGIRCLEECARLEDVVNYINSHAGIDDLRATYVATLYAIQSDQDTDHPLSADSTDKRINDVLNRRMWYLRENGAFFQSNSYAAPQIARIILNELNKSILR